MRNQNRTLLTVVAGFTIFIGILLFGLIFVLLKNKLHTTSIPTFEEQTLEAVEIIDPWAEREEEVIALVQARSITISDESLTTIGTRAQQNLLENTIEFFGLLEGVEATWTAVLADNAYPSVYWVDLAFVSGTVQVGPRWAVQLDPEGPRGEFPDGIIPANALAEYLMLPNPSEQVRFYNRADGVLEALTNHRFEGGVRLGAALLVYFLGRQQADDDSVDGWVIVPTSIREGEAPMYDAYFQYKRGGTPQIAQWRVNLETGSFRARNLQASDIMSGSDEISTENMWSILPESITDPESPPEDERNRLMRGIRRVIHNDRLVEAVNALMTYQTRRAEVAYVGWAADRAEDGLYDIRYRYTIDGEENAVSWRVNPDDTAVIPNSEIAITAARVLQIERIPDLPENVEESVEQEENEQEK